MMSEDKITELKIIVNNMQTLLADPQPSLWTWNTLFAKYVDGGVR